MIDIQWIHGLSLASASVVVLITWALIAKEKKARIALEAKLHAMELLLKNARRQHENLAKQFQELHGVAMGMGEQLAIFAQSFDELIEKQNQLELHDNDGKLYSRASKMVELGADLDELMQECELPKAEAELLLNIKKQSVFR